MALYVIADTHLALGDPEKTMEVFGGWRGYTEKLSENWARLVRPEDTVVLPGDISWAMGIEKAVPDFAFLDALPGTKLIGKGNHDYWWGTVRKMQTVLVEAGLSTVHFLFNNAYLCDGISVCGSRGWFFDAQEAADNARVIAREVQRLRVSIEAGLALGGEPVVFMHYPVVLDGKVCEPLLEVLKTYAIRRCYFGHIHGDLTGRLSDFSYEGVRFSLISADSLGFTPKKVALSSSFI